ncbi:MAG: DUF4936 family protein [Rhodocyclaceae bacterium]|nr:DUF4936 family protein [Rhodocyclaceae bacterium]
MSPGGALYIYYRLGEDRLEVLKPALRAMQAALAAQFGCDAGLMRRPEGDTVMEVYRGVADPAPLQAAMARHLSAMDFDHHLASGSQRHVEFFVCV